MKDKILVATWGYSMILTTWVRVVKESPKTLLVQEIESRCFGKKELEAQNLKTGYLQAYSVPITEKDRARHGTQGESRKPFRLYKRGDQWIGTPDTFSTILQFKEWDGKPQFEDHCD